MDSWTKEDVNTDINYNMLNSINFTTAGLKDNWLYEVYVNATNVYGSATSTITISESSYPNIYVTEENRVLLINIKYYSLPDTFRKLSSLNIK